MIPWRRIGRWVVFGVGALLALVLAVRYANRRGKAAAITGGLKNDLEELRAQNRADKLAAQHGAEEAVRRIEAEYTRRLETLSEQQRQEAAELRKDPAKLARYLLRASR